NQREDEGQKLPISCRVPLFVRGREANQIFSVTSLSATKESVPTDGIVMERAKVRLDEVLKGKTTYKPGDVIDVVSISDEHGRYTPLVIETPLAPGRRFLLVGMDAEDRARPLELERCLVI